MLELFFDLFDGSFDDTLSKLLMNDANAKLAVCQVRWEDWPHADFAEIRRTLILHRMTVSVGEGFVIPPPRRAV